MSLSRSQSYPSLSNAQTPSLERHDSAFMFIKNPDGEVHEPYESINTDDMFGHGRTPPKNDPKKWYFQYAMKVTRVLNNDFQSQDLFGSGPSSPQVYADKEFDIEHGLNGLKKDHKHNPALGKDTEKQGGTVQGVQVKKVFAELVNTEFDVMSICDQLMTMNYMNPTKFKACHEINKVSNGADWERVLKREFLLFLIDYPIPNEVLLQAIRQSRAQHVEPFLRATNNY